MYEFEEMVLEVFLEKQEQLFDEPVAETLEEADEFLSDCNWKERVRYSKKDGMTDIRLNINYEKLLSSSKDEQFGLYFNHIIESIQRFKLKYSKLDFQAEKLIKDLTEISDYE